MSPRMLPDVTKTYASIQLTDEQLFSYGSFNDPRYERKAKRIETPPTLDDAKAYAKAKEAMKVLQDYAWMEWGGPDYGTEVFPPSSTVTYEYLETAEEWLARCRKLREEGIE